MNPKEDPEKKHFYTYCINEKGFIKKGKKQNYLYFMNI